MDREGRMKGERKGKQPIIPSILQVAQRFTAQSTECWMRAPPLLLSQQGYIIHLINDLNDVKLLQKKRKKEKGHLALHNIIIFYICVQTNRSSTETIKVTFFFCKGYYLL
jgi:hypothetical protein